MVESYTGWSEDSDYQGISGSANGRSLLAQAQLDWASGSRSETIEDVIQRAMPRLSEPRPSQDQVIAQLNDAMNAAQASLSVPAALQLRALAVRQPGVGSNVQPIAATQPCSPMHAYLLHYWMFVNYGSIVETSSPRVASRLVDCAESCNALAEVLRSKAAAVANALYAAIEIAINQGKLTWDQGKANQNAIWKAYEGSAAAIEATRQACVAACHAQN